VAMLARGRVFTAGAVVTNSFVDEPNLLCTGVRLWRYQSTPAAAPATTTSATIPISRRRTGGDCSYAPLVEAADRCRPRPLEPRRRRVQDDRSEQEADPDPEGPRRLRNVPLPTEVSPTTKPNTAPIVVARTLSRRLSKKGASFGCIPRLISVFATSPMPPATRAAPTA